MSLPCVCVAHLSVRFGSPPVASAPLLIVYSDSRSWFYLFFFITPVSLFIYPVCIYVCLWCNIIGNYNPIDFPVRFPSVCESESKKRRMPVRQLPVLLFRLVSYLLILSFSSYFINLISLFSR